MFPWLCYSENLQGAFCKYCVAFSTNGGIGSQPLGYLIVKPLQNWKKAKEVIIFIMHTCLNIVYIIIINSSTFTIYTVVNL